MALLQTLVSLTVVCVVGPLLVQVTVVPALTDRVGGENEKSLIVTWGPDGLGEDAPPQAATIAIPATVTNHFGRMGSSR